MTSRVASDRRPHGELASTLLLMLVTRLMAILVLAPDVLLLRTPGEDDARYERREEECVTANPGGDRNPTRCRAGSDQQSEARRNTRPARSFASK